MAAKIWDYAKILKVRYYSFAALSYHFFIRFFNRFTVSQQREIIKELDELFGSGMQLLLFENNEKVKLELNQSIVVCRLGNDGKIEVITIWKRKFKKSHNHHENTTKNLGEINSLVAA